MLWHYFLISIIAMIFYLIKRNRRMVLLYNQIPSDTPQLPIIGHSYKYLGSSENKMKAFQIHGRETTSKGGVMGLWHANLLYIMVTDPVAIEYILKHCLEKDDLVKAFQLISGNGSIFAPVPIWRPRRKVLAPSFNPKNLNSFVNVFSKQGLVLTDKLKCSVSKGPISMWKYLTNYTMDSVCETTLGINVGTQINTNHPFLNAIDELFQVAATRLANPCLRSNFVFTKLPIYSKVLNYKKLVCSFVDKVIEEKKNIKNQDMNNDKKKINSLKTFLDIMIELSGDDKGYTNLELREEALVLIIAGTDTSAVGMGFTLVLLSRYPAVQEKVYQELQRVFNGSDRPLVAEDLPYLKYLEAVIKETMRLYPPVPIVVRKVEDDITLPSGLTLVKGCGIFINIWAIHRNPQYWGPDAEEFRPERFLETPLRHPASFIPFSYGPRGCLGSQYAYMSMKTTLSNLLRCYRVLPALNPMSGQIPSNEEPLKVKYDIMMRHVENYTVQLEFRS